MTFANVAFHITISIFSKKSKIDSFNSITEDSVFFEEITVFKFAIILQTRSIGVCQYLYVWPTH